jgi:hypothetical protein
MERRVMHLRWGWLARRSPEVSTRRYSAPSQCTRRSARPSLSRSTSTPLSLRTLADAHPRTPTHTQERSAPVSEHCGRRSSCSAGRAAPLRCAGSCRHARVSTGDPSLYPTPLPRGPRPSMRRRQLQSCGAPTVARAYCSRSPPRRSDNGALLATRKCYISAKCGGAACRPRRAAAPG